MKQQVGAIFAGTPNGTGDKLDEVFIITNAEGETQETEISTTEYVNLEAPNIYAPMDFFGNFIDSTKSSNILFIGDSNFDTPERMPLEALKAFLKYRKSTGVGYFSFSTNTIAMGLQYPVFTGTWTQLDIFSGGAGLDGRSVISSMANSTVEIKTDTAYVDNGVAFFNSVRVFYKVGDAGVLGYSVNGGSYTNVTLATSPTGALGAFDINLASSRTDWVIKLKLVSGSIELLGGLMIDGDALGVRLDKAAHSGAASVHYKDLSNQMSWQGMLGATNPSVVYVGLTTNDFSHAVPTGTTMENMGILIDNLKTFVKKAAIYIVAPPQYDITVEPITDVTAQINNDGLKLLCKEKEVGFVSIQEFWSKMSTDYTNTLFNPDGIHYNPTGARINASILTNKIMPQPYFAGRNTLADVTKNGNVTPSDIFVRDLSASRGTTGAIFLNDDKDRYIYWDGTYYNMPGGQLLIDGQLALTPINTSTFDIVFNKVTAPLFYLNSATPSFRNFVYSTGDVARWNLATNDDPESVGNLGSDLVLNRYADDGSYIGTILKAERSSGIITIDKLKVDNNDETPTSVVRNVDLGVLDGTATPYTKSTINTAYPTAKFGFMVICDNANAIYVKKDNSPTGNWSTFPSVQLT